MIIASGSADLKFHAVSGELFYTYAPSKCQSNDRNGTPSSGSTGFTHLCWSKDGSWMSLIPANNYVEIISLRDNNFRHLSVIKDIREPSCASFQHATKKQIAVGTRNGAILIYDFKARTVNKEFPRVDSSVFSLHYCLSDSHLICGCANGQIMVFNAQSMINVTVFRIPKSNTLTTVRCHPRKRSLIVGGSESGVVAVWDINSKSNKYAGQQHHAIVTDAMFVPNRSDLVVSIGTDRKIRFQDIENRISIIDIALERNVNCMDMCHNGVTLAVGMQSGQVLVYDIRNMKAPTATLLAHDGPVNHIALRPTPVNVTAASKTEFSIEDQTDHPTGKSDGLVSDHVEVHQNRRPTSLCNIPESQSEQMYNNGDEEKDSFLAALSMNMSATSAIGGTVGNIRRRSSLRRSNTKTHESSDGDDSFLNAVGLCGTGSNSSSARNSAGSRTAFFPPNTLAQDQCSNTPIIEECSVLDEETSVSSNRPLTKLIMDKMSSTPSYSYSPIHVLADERNFKANVQEVVRAELKDMLATVVESMRQHTSEVQRELQHDLVNVMSHNRQYFLGLEFQMMRNARRTEGTLSEFADALIQKGQAESEDSSVYHKLFALEKQVAELKMQNQDLLEKLLQKEHLNGM